MKQLTLLLFILHAIILPAQQFDWYANFENIMDNREYDSSIGHDQTVLGARLDFAVGLKQDSTSGAYLGVNYMMEYGGNIDSITPSFNLYYEINRDDFGFVAGSFPRNKVLNAPLFMISDTVRYYSPNMGGMAFDIRRKWGHQNLFVDWTGRQAPDKRESFIAGTSGLFQKENFYIENYIYMYHYALRSVADPDEHIQDNGVASAFFGLDYADKTALDILRFDIGGIANYDRKRPADFTLNTGIMGRASAYYKRFGIDLTSYWGDELDLPLGDTLYKNGNYTRLDLCAIPIIGEKLETTFKFSCHFVGDVFSTSQQFFLIARF